VNFRVENTIPKNLFFLAVFTLSAISVGIVGRAEKPKTIKSRFLLQSDLISLLNYLYLKTQGLD
jgi:hypothetical protein